MRIKQISKLAIFFILLISLICIIMGVSAMARSPKQFPGKLIRIEGSQVTTSQEEFVKNNTISVVAKRGIPIYALQDGIISLNPPPRSVALWFEESKIHMWLGGNLKPNFADGQQFKSGDIIGWFPESEQQLMGMDNVYQIPISCGDDGANDPRIYVEGLQEYTAEIV